MTDERRERALVLAYMLADYGRNGAGGDDTPEQQRFGADCMEAAALLIEESGFCGDMRQNALADTVAAMRKRADELEKARDRRAEYGYALAP